MIINNKILIPILDRERILCISLTYRGFGFLILENAKIIIDWGHASVEFERLLLLIKSGIINLRVKSIICCLVTASCKWYLPA